MNPLNDIELTTQVEREARYNERNRKDREFEEEIARLGLWEDLAKCWTIFFAGLLIGVILMILVG